MWNVCLAFIFQNVAQIDKRPTTDFVPKTSNYQQVISVLLELFRAFLRV